METQRQVVSQVEGCVEDAPLVLEELATNRPPDQITLPQAETQDRPAASQPLARLAKLGQDITQVKAIEPPPKPVRQYRMIQRPTEGFE